MALEAANERIKVIVLPITHRAPKTPANGLEIPLDVKRRLKLDFEHSWVIVSEANVFVWPGPDLRPLPAQGVDTIAYGFLPPGFFRSIREAYLAFVRRGQLLVVDRTE